ncbi:MAG: response regulator transcription factor, partial [Caldilineaceae bacterium]|nr:response regulator transcription factor [Caldilineaceae bacterium]
MGTGNRQVHSPAIIYLVDDEESIRGYVAKILESEAYEIYSADSGHAALVGIQALYEAGRTVDVILLDIAMPVIDGFEVLVELRARYQSDPPQVIMLSGKTATSEKVFAFNAGAADYIQKPFHPTELLARIANQVALRQARQQLIRSEQMTTAI